MSIKTSKRIALGVIAALVFAPFAAIAPASAAEATEVTAVSVAAPGTGRVGSVFTSLVSVVVAGGVADGDTITLRARFEEKPATSTAAVGFSSAGLTMVDANAAPALLVPTIRAAGAAGNELLPAKVTLAQAAADEIADVALNAAAGKAGSVGFIPDVAGTYKVLVWNDVNGDGLVGTAESKSAVITFTVGNAPVSVKVTSLSGTGILLGDALVKLELLDSAGAAAGLASNESITLTSSSANTDFTFVNTTAVDATPNNVTLQASSFVKGVSYIRFHQDTAAATPTITIAGVGGSVTALSGTFTQKFVAATTLTAGATVMTTGGTTAATFGAASNNGVQGNLTDTDIPVATKSLTYLTTVAAAAAIAEAFASVAITDQLGLVSGSVAQGITGLVFSRAITLTESTTTAGTYTGLTTITVTSPTAAGNAFSAVFADDTGTATDVDTALISLTGLDSVTVSPSVALSLQTGGSITYTVTVKDQFGRVLPNASVVRTGGTRNASVVLPAAVTDASGIASFTVTDAPAAGVTSLTDTFSFTASFNGIAGTAKAAGAITWSATALAVGTVALATPTTLDVAPAITYSDINAGATGAQATVVTVSATVKDASGNLLAGVPVTFTTADTGAAVLTTTATGYTSAAGVATASVYGWRTGIKTFTATAGGIAGTGTVNFNQQTATEARTVSAALVGKLATVTVKDRFGNTIEGVNILGTRTGTGYFGTGSTSATGTTDKNGEASFVVEGVGTFKFSATTTLGVENLEFGQTSAIKGNAVGALATGVLTATVAGTAIKAETGVGASFDAAGANSATVTTTAPVAPAVVVPPVVYDNPTLSFVKDGSRVILSGTAVDGEGDIIIYTKKVGTTAWKERAKTLEVAAPGDFNGSIKAPKSNVLIRVKQEGTGQFSNQVIVLK